MLPISIFNFQCGRVSWSFELEWENGIFTIPFSNSNSELELQHALSSQIIQYFSNVALFVSFRDPVRGFVSEGVAKAAGF